MPVRKGIFIMSLFAWIRKRFRWGWSWIRESNRYVVPQDLHIKTLLGMLFIPIGRLFDGISFAPNGPMGLLLIEAATHDELYQVPRIEGKNITRKQADKVLKEFMEQPRKAMAGIPARDAMPKRAKLYYVFLRALGGKAWKKYRKSERDAQVFVKKLNPDEWTFVDWERKNAVRR